MKTIRRAKFRWGICEMVTGRQFKVHGRLNGQNTIMLDDGEIIVMSDRDLERFEKENTRMSTNDFDEMRPLPAAARISGSRPGGMTKMAEMAFEQMAFRIEALEQQVETLVKELDALRPAKTSKSA